jgi:hypothetical protein
MPTTSALSVSLRDTRTIQKRARKVVTRRAHTGPSLTGSQGKTPRFVTLIFHRGVYHRTARFLYPRPLHEQPITVRILCHSLICHPYLACPQSLPVRSDVRLWLNRATKQYSCLLVIPHTSFVLLVAYCVQMANRSSDPFSTPQYLYSMRRICTK